MVYKLAVCKQIHAYEPRPVSLGYDRVIKRMIAYVLIIYAYLQQHTLLLYIFAF